MSTLPTPQPTPDPASRRNGRERQRPSKEQEARIRQAAKLKAEGHTFAEIGQAMGVTRAAVHKWASLYRNIWESICPSIDEQREAKIQQAAELRLDGWTLGRIAAKLGIPVRTINDWRRNYPDLWGDAPLPCFRGLTEEREKLVRRAATLRARRWSIRRVAEELAVTQKTIWQWSKSYADIWQDAYATEKRIQQAGAHRPGQDDGDELLTTIRIVAALRAGGCTWEEIAKTVDRKRGTIVTWPKVYPDEWADAFTVASKHRSPISYARTLINSARPVQVELSAGHRAVSHRGDPIRHDVREAELTLTEFFDKYYRPERLELQGANDSTVKAYELALARWRDHTDDPPLWQVNDSVIARWLTELGKTRSPSTVNKNGRHIAAILRYAGPRGYRAAAAKGILAEVPYVPVLKLAKRVPEAWTMEQLGQILASCQQEKGSVAGIPAGTFWYALVLFLYVTGLRKNAALNLRVEHMHFASGTVLVPAELQKQFADQAFKLTDACVQALAATFPPDRDLLFPWPKDRFKTSSWRCITIAFRQIILRAGLPATSKDLFHKLRRTTATHLANSQGLDFAQQHLGHSTQWVTKMYVDPRQLTHAKRAADALPEPVPPQPAPTANVEPTQGPVVSPTPPRPSRRSDAVAAVLADSPLSPAALKAVLADFGVTQKDFAKWSSLSRGQLSDVLSGKQPLVDKFEARIRAALQKWLTRLRDQEAAFGELL